MGAKLYGTPLQTNNGRNVGQDMVEEILDFAQYQQQHIMELEAKLDGLRPKAEWAVAHGGWKE